MLAMSTIHTKTMNRNIVWTSKARSSKSPDVSKSVAAFTLVELLTVIAIIAILSAIIFPVFNNARESGRRGVAVSNLAKIQNGLELYKLDHRNKDYPPVLFAYAAPGFSMSDVRNVGSAESWAAAHPGVVYPLSGLYPQYINDASVFTDPNNKEKDASSSATVSAKINVLDRTTGDLNAVPTAVSFYTADAYDVSPHITSTTSTDSQYVTRYQTAWTSTPMPTGFTPATEFPRQLDQQVTSDDTYLTMTTYHVQNFQKVIILFKSGSAKVFDPAKLLSPGCGDTTDISASGGVANAKFWMIKPSGACP